MKTTTIKLYLDTRRLCPDVPAPLKIIVRRDGQAASIATGIKIDPKDYDAKSGKVINSPQASRLNLHIGKLLLDAEAALLSLKDEGKVASMSAAQIRDAIAEALMPGASEAKLQGRLFRARFTAYGESREKASTRRIYLNTVTLLDAFDRKLDERAFEDIDRDFLQDFIRWLAKSGMKQNSINIHLRNIRAVFNAAIDDDVTSAYPFRKIKIKPQATSDRSMTADELRRLFSCPAADWQREYVDMFKLMFCLRGINIGDLALLTDIRGGRIEYVRQKTGRLYSVKLEPEALEIIGRYRGESHLLSILDRYSDYHDYAKHLNHGLQTVGLVWENGRKYSGSPLFPEMTSYWARYSWASIAAELDIPRETIAAGLGHSWADVTAIYIRADMTKKVDAANRRVLDYVFGR